VIGALCHSVTSRLCEVAVTAALPVPRPGTSVELEDRVGQAVEGEALPSSCSAEVEPRERGLRFGFGSVEGAGNNLSPPH
jgi:hypothetical protein